MDLLKLVIVDDEPIILRGLVETYPWAEMGFKVVGSATNAKQAIDIIFENKPNIVLTDIKMKNMDGLTMMKEIKKIEKNIIFIVISAYRDFEYAQEACDIGAFSYILKPIEDEKLKSTMEDAYKICTEKLQKQTKYNNLQKVLFENADNFQSILIERYLKDIITLDELKKIFCTLNKDISENNSFVTICIDIDISYKITNQLDFETQRFALYSHLNKTFASKYDIWKFDMNDGKMVFIINMSKEKEKSIDSITTYIEEVRAFFNINIISAISSELYGLNGLKKTYEQALKMYEIANEAGASILTALKDSVLDVNENVYSEYIEQSVVNTIRKNDAEQFKKAYEKFIYSMPCSQTDDYIRKYIHRLALNIDFMLNDTYGLTETVKNSFDNFYSNLNSINPTKAISILFQILNNVIDERIKNPQNQTAKYFKEYISKTMDYIEEHIDDDTLSITTVSSQIFLNSVYFGRVFKNTLGISFKQYVLNKRMELSKKLISEGNDTINSICEKVGILNPSYFSQLFKQYTGYLPSEYKKEIGL